MKTSIAAVLLSALLAGCAGQGEQPSTDKGVAAISERTLASHIKTLASDEFGGRAPGTEGERLTVEYMVNAFKKAGLKPANGDKYTQAVPLASVEATNNPSVHITGGAGPKATLKYRDDQVVWTRHQVEEVTVHDSEMVFVGYGINAPERNWNDYAGVDVRGKTVVMLVNDPGYATQDPELFNGNAMTYYGRWNYKMDEAARQGAAGAIIIHDTKPASYPWGTVRASWTGPQFDLVLPDKGADLALIEGWIGKNQAEALFARAGLNLAEQYEAAKTPGFKAVPMNLKFEATVKNRLNRVDSNNIVGMIEGSEAPDEVFVYMAHWDHIGIRPEKEGDNIYNGALDNATGTAGLIEIAKAFTALPKAPRRSIMFMAVTAEEQGLLGSAYYAANPLMPLAKTVGGVNMDGLSNFGRARDITLISHGFSELDEYVIRQAKRQDRVVVPNPKPERGSFYRSDHFRLAKLGVPMIYASPGRDHREKGREYGMAKAAEYTANHYHAPSDEYDDSWDLSGAVEDLELYFLTGHEIADGHDWPNWLEGTEFKAIRDQQRAGQ